MVFEKKSHEIIIFFSRRLLSRVTCASMSTTATVTDFITIFLQD